jgi:hypothetical protein
VAGVRRCVIFAIVWVLGPGSLAAQGLGEAAARERRRREEEQAKRKPGKVYTNDDLSKGEETAAAAQETSSAQSLAQRQGSTRGRPRENPDDPNARDRRRDQVSEGDEANKSDPLEQSRWREQAQQRRDAVSALEAQIKTLQQEIEALAGKLLMSTDTNEMLRLREEKTQAESRLQEAQSGLAEARKALETFEQDARRAGVPPGWIR